MSRPTPLACAYASRAHGTVELLGWQYYDPSRSRVRAGAELAARR